MTIQPYITLGHHLAKLTYRQLSPTQVIKVVARHYNLKPATLKQRKRTTKNIRHARLMAMYCCCQFTPLPKKEIADLFRCHHTSLYHPLKQYHQSPDPQVQKELAQIEEKLTMAVLTQPNQEAHQWTIHPGIASIQKELNPGKYFGKTKILSIEGVTEEDLPKVLKAAQMDFPEIQINDRLIPDILHLLFIACRLKGLKDRFRIAIEKQKIVAIPEGRERLGKKRVGEKQT